MKKITILLLMIFSIIGCEKDNNDDPHKPSELIAEIKKLPPATQIGANKVGCLLDDKALLPSGFNPTQCFYQYTNGGYYFVMAFGKKDSNFNVVSVGVGTQKLEIHQGGTYDLVEISDNNAYGGYIYGFDQNYTTHTGELKITKLDPNNYIVSGTFWFDVEDTDGVVHQIREGRFDMHYTN